MEGERVQKPIFRSRTRYGTWVFEAEAEGRDFLAPFVDFTRRQSGHVLGEAGIEKRVIQACRERNIDCTVIERLL